MDDVVNDGGQRDGDALLKIRGATTSREKALGRRSRFLGL